jgi:Flp pilus assembly protein TadB
MPSLTTLLAIMGAVLVVAALLGLLELRRVVGWDRTPRAWAESRWLDRSAEALAQAELDRLPALAWVGGRLALSVVAGIAAWLFFNVALFAPVGALVVYHALGMALERRRRRLETERQQALLDALRYGIAVMSRAGNAMQMVRALAETGPSKARAIFASVVMHVDRGDGALTLTSALELERRRVADPLLDDLALAVTINARHGGRLVPALERVLADWEKRWELRRKAKGLRAGQELSVRVVAFLPYALLAILQIIDPRFLDPLHTASGQLVLAMLIASMTFGYRVLQRKTAPPREERLQMADLAEVA